MTRRIQGGCRTSARIRARSSRLHRHPMAYMGGLDRANQGVKTVHVNLLPGGRVDDDAQHLLRLSRQRNRPGSATSAHPRIR